MDLAGPAVIWDKLTKADVKSNAELILEHLKARFGDMFNRIKPLRVLAQLCAIAPYLRDKLVYFSVETLAAAFKLSERTMQRYKLLWFKAGLVKLIHRYLMDNGKVECFEVDDYSLCFIPAGAVERLTDGIVPNFSNTRPKNHPICHPMSTNTSTVTRRGRYIPNGKSIMKLEEEYLDEVRHDADGQEHPGAEGREGLDLDGVPDVRGAVLADTASRGDAQGEVCPQASVHGVLPLDGQELDTRGARKQPKELHGGTCEGSTPTTGECAPCSTVPTSTSASIPANAHVARETLKPGVLVSPWSKSKGMLSCADSAGKYGQESAVGQVLSVFQRLGFGSTSGGNYTG